jgi:zinc/manganese transport system substrate-binding protein
MVFNMDVNNGSRDGGPMRPRSLRRQAARRVIVLCLPVVLGACGGSGSGAAGPSVGGSTSIRVVAGENFWGDIVSQLGGSHVQVTSIISDPNADPHEYESSASNAAAIARAKLVVENGLGYDGFMNKLLSASPSSARVVLSVQKILEVTGSNPNPHIWYDTARLPQVAAAIVAELSKLDPADSATFAANGKAFDASLDPILAVISSIKAKYSGDPIAYTERVAGYLVDAAGLQLAIPAMFAQAIEDGDDPSPADTAAFDSAITGKKVKLLLYNGQVTDPTTDKIKKLATSAGVPIVGVTETMPKTDANFQAWQLRQAKEILAALGG